MNYEEFLQICRDVQKDFRGEGCFDEIYYNNYDYKNKIKDNPRLFVEWRTGGYSGGSCWGDVAEAFTSDEKPGELEILDTILEKVSPNLTFLQYRALTQKLERYDTHTVGEYYGNSNDYANKTILVKELFDYLKEKNLI